MTSPHPLHSKTASLESSAASSHSAIMPYIPSPQSPPIASLSQSRVSQLEGSTSTTTNNNSNSNNTGSRAPGTPVSGVGTSSGGGNGAGGGEPGSYLFTSSGSVGMTMPLLSSSGSPLVIPPLFPANPSPMTTAASLAPALPASTTAPTDSLFAVPSYGPLLQPPPQQLPQAPKPLVSPQLPTVPQPSPSPQPTSPPPTQQPQPSQPPLPQPQPPAQLSSPQPPQTATQSNVLWDELRQRDAQILVLTQKLGHFRSWLAQVHARVQAANPSAINNYKRLYVGNLPPNTTEEELKQFLHSLMVRTGANAAPGSAILSCKLKAAAAAGAAPGSSGPVPPPGPGPPDKHYAFIELRSVEEASNAMAFDGVAFRNAYLKVRRPSNYDAATAMTLGPTMPDPTIDLSQLEICRTVVENSPHKLFVGGLPCEWTEDMVKELLLPYGTLKSFNLVMDKSTGKSKGYAFCEYVEDSSADLLIKNLHLRRVGSKALTVKRAMEGSRGGAAGSTAAAAGAVLSLAGAAAASQSPHSPQQAASQLMAPYSAAAHAMQHTHSHAQPLSGHPHAHAHAHTPQQPHHMLVGSPPQLPLTPASVAAMAKLAASPQGAGGGSPGAAGGGPGGAGGSGGGVGGGAAVTASILDNSTLDALTVFLQQNASRNLLAAAAASGAQSASHAPSSATAAGLAAALHQLQRSSELVNSGVGPGPGNANVGGPGCAGGSGELQQPMGLQPMGLSAHHSMGAHTHPHAHPHAHLAHSQSHPHPHAHPGHPHGHPHVVGHAQSHGAVGHGHPSQHAHQQQREQHEAAAAAAAAVHEAAAAQQLFDLSSLAGHHQGNLGFW